MPRRGASLSDLAGASASAAATARRRRLSQTIFAVGCIYLLFIAFKFHHFLALSERLAGDDLSSAYANSAAEAFASPSPPARSTGPSQVAHVAVLLPRAPPGAARNGSQLERMADEAWSLGEPAWRDAVAMAGSSADPGSELSLLASTEQSSEPCPPAVSMSGGNNRDLYEKVMFLPCGLAAGSSVTVVGIPQEAHEEYVPQLAKMRGGDGTVLVSQFAVELRGLQAVDGEEPPKILHLNPRVRGDWIGRPVIEHNTCYRMQWGTALRCDGSSSKDDGDTVDGFTKCEKWVRNDIVDTKESKTTSWLRRFVGRANKPEMTWPFPFVEGRLFVLTIQAGVEGFHIYVGGRHITSFPYRLGFTLEDATGLVVKGNVDLHAMYATALPLSHPSFSLQQVLEMSETWKSKPLPSKKVFLFIGILSASNHFAERMAARKTWMQYPEIKSSAVVARFFVALNPRKEVNAVLKKEAEYFGDIVIVPFIDRYELVVLKTIAICEYGLQNVSAAYIMKGDDDTFVRVDAVLAHIMAVATDKTLYLGNLNFLHRPLRHGKWAVTEEEWPEDIYPPYANGPGYIISIDIARFIASRHAEQRLRLFKMEDVSMGLWVGYFNATVPVQYSHSWKFCQYGCVENYLTSHYQSPRQMLCLWDKLARGQPYCCNYR